MYQTFEIIRVPFPYSDLEHYKERPALVLSQEELFNQGSSHVVVAMITSAIRSSFPLDVRIQHWQEASLPRPCLVRMKLFTIDQRKIISREGYLHTEDRQNVITALKKLLPFHQQ